MATIQRKQRSEQDLRNASNDLYYEFWMFIKLANGLATGILGESVINNALLESFAIHAKVMLDFLYNDSPGDGQVSALDFVPSAEDWIRRRPRMSAALEAVRADILHRTAREIAVLPYDRHVGAPERTLWPFMQIAKEVNSAFDAFLAIAPRHFLGPRWQEVKQQRRSRNGNG